MENTAPRHPRPSIIRPNLCSDGLAIEVAVRVGTYHQPLTTAVIGSLQPFLGLSRAPLTPAAQPIAMFHRLLLTPMQNAVAIDCRGPDTPSDLTVGLLVMAGGSGLR